MVNTTTQHTSRVRFGVLSEKTSAASKQEAKFANIKLRPALHKSDLHSTETQTHLQHASGEQEGEEQLVLLEERSADGDVEQIGEVAVDGLRTLVYRACCNTKHGSLERLETRISKQAAKRTRNQHKYNGTNKKHTRTL